MTDKETGVRRYGEDDLGHFYEDDRDGDWVHYEDFLDVWKRSAWIACKDRMPEIPEGAVGSPKVLTWMNGWPRIAVRYQRHWEREGGRTAIDFGEVTHWMPMPHPPTDARGGE